MKAHLTGGGLIGAYAARELLQAGYQVGISDIAPLREYICAVAGSAELSLSICDCRDVEGLTSILREERPDVIVHAAAALSANFTCDAFGSYATNTYGALCVVEAARRAEVPRVVLCSSLALYDFDAPAGVTMTEEHPTAPGSLYDWSKLLAEMLVRPFCEEHGIELVVLRFAGVYGAGHYPGGSWMGGAIQSLALASIQHGEVCIEPDRLGVNEYLYVKDAAWATRLACEVPGAAGETFNVGAGQLTAPRQVGESLVIALPGVRVCYAPTAHTPIPSYLQRCAPLSINKAAQVLSYTPRYASMVQGMQDYVVELERLRDVLPLPR